ncbi:MAG TPA: hypothetical protein VE915_07655 [Actinomycetota bacterium]|nr:hypothetical protein [Actinomycetota bacterium]
MRRLIVAVGLTVLATACTGTGQKTDSTAQGSSSPQAAVTGLCEAQSLASGGGLDEARQVFQDQSHAYLHQLAAELQERDRSLAAELLEAKQQVERALQAGADPELLADLIGRLRAVVESALASMGMANVGCFK